MSRIPTASLKTFAIPPRAVVGLLILVAVAAALLVTYPYLLMFVAILGYLAHIPFAWRSRRWVERRPEAWDTPPRERRAERRALRHVSRSGPRKSEARLGLRRPERR